MKDIAIKSLFLLSVLVMVDYLIMIIVGCVSNYLGCSLNYFECAFCTIGQSVFGFSLLLLGVTMVKDIKSLHTRSKSE
ncbi:hypothetical protein HZY62_09725 [Maribacter polysiphoniae]|uniref:Uncharacterized protein n=1 Tax=Maribacter polysiphoniae TaxID=429344 RepID=A0A316E2W8_9FLAO|nr:hypothetical protein [Maribacter polysiphoniae]MBD1260864.1 hypothetical protein [Maribacter polysiphoniae]PWK23998.1 hypothetical protein LX92_01584 [Maribacter polysiphoniae]